jgi:sigma-B regulation protein RsbU (phosphoserine phosphatase)
VLRGLARDVSTVLDLGELGRKVGDMLARSMMVDCGCLLVRPAPDSPLAHVAGFGRQETDPVLIRALEERVTSASTSDLVDVDELLAGTGLVPPVRLVLVPLRHGGELLGMLLLGRKVTGTGFNAEDRALLATLGDQIGVAIKNSHLHRASVAKTLLDEELSFARNVQQRFLPAEFPPMSPLDLWARNVPSKVVSGDYYDVVPIGEHDLLIAIGDVSGKGVPAALLMSMLRASLRTQAREPISLCEMMRSLNRLIFESTSDREFVTLFLARVDCRGLRLRYSNGGHNPPLLRRRDGSLERLERGGLLLGAFDGVEFEEGEVILDRRDMLVLYTDGLTEAVDAGGDMFGDERLEAAVRALDPGSSAREGLMAIEGACRSFSDGTDLEDDLTVLVLRVGEDELKGELAGGRAATRAAGAPLEVSAEDPPWT